LLIIKSSTTTDKDEATRRLELPSLTATDLSLSQSTIVSPR
jgi:hypothetical protein